jgi:hypothetical protein
MNSQAWEKKILAGRGVLTSTIQPRWVLIWSCNCRQFGDWSSWKKLICQSFLGP